MKTTTAITTIAIGSPDLLVAATSDVTGDGLVNVSDVLQVLEHWGACQAACPSDATGDNIVDILDLLMVLEHWSCQTDVAVEHLDVVQR